MRETVTMVTITLHTNEGTTEVRQVPHSSFVISENAEGRSRVFRFWYESVDGWHYKEVPERIQRRAQAILALHYPQVFTVTSTTKH